MDDATSHSPPRKPASPLRACPLSSIPPAPASGDLVFGGPGSIPSLSDDDERYVLLLCELFLTAMLFPLSGMCQYLLYYQRCGGRYQSSTRSRCLPYSRGFSCECATIPAAGVTLTTPTPSVDKVVAASDLAPSSSRPAIWEEHVSVLYFDVLRVLVGFRTLIYYFAAVWSRSMRGWQSLLRDGAGKRCTSRYSRDPVE